jgi:hypothetical protein
MFDRLRGDIWTGRRYLRERCSDIVRLASARAARSLTSVSFALSRTLRGIHRRVPPDQSRDTLSGLTVRTTTEVPFV